MMWIMHYEYIVDETLAFHSCSKDVKYTHPCERLLAFFRVGTEYACFINDNVIFEIVEEAV